MLLSEDRLIEKLSRCLRYDARFVATSLGQDRPGDAGQLICERSSQNVMMQPFGCNHQSAPKTMLRPICWPKQDHAGLAD